MQWFLGIRVLVIALFLGGTILFQLQGNEQQQYGVLQYLYLLVAVSFLQALVSLVSVKIIGPMKWLAQVQIAWDLVFVTVLIYLTGGIESIFPSFFILVILGSVLLLSRREVLIVASAAAILYGILIDLQYYNYLPEIPGISLPLHIDGAQALYKLFINTGAFLLVGILGGLLVGRLRHSESARQQMEIDYEELERLNRAILENMASGLMIVDRHLRIRSLNAAAEEMLGAPIKEIYNADVSLFFPDAVLMSDGRFQVISRGEGRLVARAGHVRPIGFNTSILADPARRVDGLLVTFQDLTHLKEMEERLKRTDRLAAVGQLAAGLAHEIRNPLASISGSVQLLQENAGLDGEDQRLMRIVVREADRLNDLLKEFLVFARPAPPEKAWFRAVDLVHELSDLSFADPRFAAIEIRRGCPPDAWVFGDRKQLRQAIWNLLINAAEAMANGGRLDFEYFPVSGELVVADTGPGVPAALRQKIYDPFFTTKDHGTGLGLATVHSIVEAHGGTLELKDNHGGGARFVIRLPAEEVI